MLPILLLGHQALPYLSWALETSRVPSSSKSPWGQELFTEVSGLGASDFYLLLQKRRGKLWAQLC